MNRCKFTSHITYACPLLSNVPILTLSQTSHDFYVSAIQVFGNTVGKGEIALSSNFSFSHSVFYAFRELSAIFIKLGIVVSKLLEESKICRLGKG